MRVVVIAVKNDRAAVAGKGGSLKYIENMNYEVGQILDVPMEVSIADNATIGGSVSDTAESGVSEPVAFSGKKVSLSGKLLSFRRFGSSFAAAAAVLLFTGGVCAYALPLSFVTIDVNPSLSMGVNAFNRVITAEGTNDDGSELLHGLSGEIMGKELPEAVDLVFSGLRDNDYIAEIDTPAEGTVRGLFSDRHNERMMNELKTSAERWNEQQKDCSVSFEAVSVTKELRLEAEKMGMTPGRMMLERRQEELSDKEPLPEVSPDVSDKEEDTSNGSKVNEDPASPSNDGRTPDHDDPSGPDAVKPGLSGENGGNGALPSGGNGSGPSDANGGDGALPSGGDSRNGGASPSGKNGIDNGNGPSGGNGSGNGSGPSGGNGGDNEYVPSGSSGGNGSAPSAGYGVNGDNGSGPSGGSGGDNGSGPSGGNGGNGALPSGGYNAGNNPGGTGSGVSPLPAGNSSGSQAPSGSGAVPSGSGVNDPYLDPNNVMVPSTPAPSTGTPTGSDSDHNDNGGSGNIEPSPSGGDHNSHSNDHGSHDGEPRGHNSGGNGPGR